MLALFFAAPAYSQDNPIIKRMETFAKAFNAQDANAISEHYADKGALLPPRGKPLVGRKAIAGYYAKAFGAGVKDLKYKIEEIDQAGPSTAIEIGQSQVKIGTETVLSRYIHVWKLENNVWHLNRDMFHILGSSN